MDRVSPGLVLTCNDALRRSTGDGAFVRTSSEAAAAMTSPVLTLLSPVRPEPPTADSSAELRSVLSAAQRSGLLPLASQPRPAAAPAQPDPPAATSRSSARSLSPAFRCDAQAAKSSYVSTLLVPNVLLLRVDYLADRRIAKQPQAESYCLTPCRPLCRNVGCACHEHRNCAGAPCCCCSQTSALSAAAPSRRR